MSTSTLRVALIEDQADFREQCKSFLDQQEDTLCIISCSSCSEFLDSLKPFHQIDVLLLDINLPNRSGIEALTELREKIPDTRIVMYTVEENEELLFKAFSKGAHGYVIKNGNWEDLYHFLQIVKKGGAAISPRMAKALIRYFQPPARPKGRGRLGQKDHQVLNLLAQGWSYQYIAEELDMTIDNVRYYIRKLYKRLEVHSRHEATRKFIDNPEILRQV